MSDGLAALPMRDRFGRRIDYLRISVTDKCNLRCVYCMPVEGLPWIPREELLTDDEIVRVVREFAALGTRRLRITGGEPTVRPGLAELVRRLAAVPGIEDIALSTNGVLLPKMAAELRAAGIRRVNISLDTLREDRFERIARRPARVYREIREGIEAAEAAGFDPVKINVVVLRGWNDDEIEDFAALTRERPWHVRFIELMPTGANLEIVDAFISADEILARVRALGTLEPVPGPFGNGPARYYAFPGAPGTVGVITPLSHTYCMRCNRVRLLADGQLRTCLFGTHQVDLRTPLRAGRPLGPVILDALAEKPERHYLQLGSAIGSGGLLALSQTGG
jgi:cyclic pyranopterin phosphate synthase